MDIVTNLQIAAATAASRAETYKIGDEIRNDLEWFASKAESLAAAITRGAVQGDRIAAEVAKLNEIGAEMPVIIL